MQTDFGSARRKLHRMSASVGITPQRSVRVAPARQADWSEVHRLLVKCFAYMDGRIDPPSSLTRMPPEAVAQKARDETVILAKADRQLIGCAFLTERADAIYLGKVAIDPAYRGRGILAQMIDAADTAARAAGKRHLELQTRVELIENHRTFERVGFRKWAETRHPGFDRTTSITMRRAVPAAAGLARVGHNGGPPLDAPSTRWARLAWTAAQKRAWSISPETARRRLRQAEACGLTFREYMLELLNTGRHLQPTDTEAIAAIVARRN